jgi:predicted nucleic acid-binding protein
MMVVLDTHLVEPVPVPEGACDDADDLKFLGCAVAGRASCIVSGDRALLRASGFEGIEGIEVLTPRAFTRRYL